MACILVKTLWIVSGGAEAVPGIKRAKELGYYVVVSDGAENAPGFAFADDKVVVSTYDVSASVAAAKEYHQRKRQLDGVICMSADVPLTVASIAYELGLPGIPIETAKLSMDKIKMKERFLKDGIPTAWFCAIESAEHLAQVVSEKKIPLIIKPADSRGARGVLRLTETVSLPWAYENALKYSPTSRVMVEEFLEGDQVSTEAIIIDGKGYTFGFSDRNYEYLKKFSPYIIENGGEQPTKLTNLEKESIENLAINAAKSLGLTTGIAKGDMILTKDGAKVIEIATRLSGGWFSTDQIPLSTGVDLIGLAIRLAIGQKIEDDELIPKHQIAVAIRYFFPEQGKIVSISNVEKYEKKEWVYKIGMFMGIGDVVEDVTNHTKRVGFVITTGKDKLEAVKRAQEVVANIIIKTDKI